MKPGGGAGGGHCSLVGVGVIPVGSVYRRGTAGKCKAEAEAAGGDEIRNDFGCNGIAASGAAGFDSDGDAVEIKSAGEDAGPKVEGLMNLCQIRGFSGGAVGVAEIQPNTAKVQSMRIFPHPIEKFFLPLGFSKITDFAAVGVVIGITDLVRIQAGRQWPRVPAPLRLGAQGNAFFICFGKSLKAGDVGPEGKFAVADRQRASWVQRFQDDVVTGYDGAAIDPQRRVGRWC